MSHGLTSVAMLIEILEFRANHSQAFYIVLFVECKQHLF